jgi:hypothetical protein
VSPRAHWVLGAAAARLASRPTLAHVGSDPRMVELLASSANVLVWPAELTEELPDRDLDAVIAFDVLERSSDFVTTLRRYRSALRPGGLLFVTTMSSEGFEVRMLGPRMRSLVPPVHLQLLSKRGWTTALGREGFALVEYSTPGELDVQAVADACRREPQMRLPPILDALVRHEDELVTRSFQDLLQQAGLSSHVQLVAEAV